MGYVNPDMEPACSAVFSYRVDAHAETTKTMLAMDSLDFSCHVRGEHEIHEAQRDFPNLGKTVFISWGKGKPRIIETSLSSASVQSLAVLNQGGKSPTT